MDEKKAKILFIDIENTPLKSLTWGRWEQNVIHVEQESYVLSFSYKWADEKKAHVIALNDFKGYKPNVPDDKKLIEEIYKIMSSADIIVGQNIRSFDIKKLNARFIFYGMKPIAPYKTVDTLVIARKRFSFSSNKLDDLGKFLGLGQKIRTGGYSLWVDCMNGDKKAWAKMKAYNLQDTILLERVYLKLRSWDTNHVNIGMYMDGKSRCATCGSTSLQSRGFSRNKTTKYHRFFCNDCGSWGRDTKNIQKTKPLISI